MSLSEGGFEMMTAPCYADVADMTIAEGGWPKPMDVEPFAGG